MVREKLNNTEYHKKYLDFLWVIYVKTFPRASKLNLSFMCKEHNTDKRIMGVLIKEKILWKNKGAYLWTGNLPDVKVTERVVRQMRLSRKKHLKTGVQRVNGYKKGDFTKEEKETFLNLLQEGYNYGYIAEKLNRQVSLLRRYKHRLKKKGFDVSPAQFQSEQQFETKGYSKIGGEEHSITPIIKKSSQLRLLP